jgi:capsular exopolysaccharide synthesis family protein
MQDEILDNADQRELRLADYWSILVRRSWIIGITFTVLFVAVALYSFTRPATYESAATFIIDSADDIGLGSMFGGRSPLVGQQRRPLEFYQALIKSQIYMDLAIQAASTDSALRSFHLSNEMLYDLFKNRVQLISSTKSELVKISFESINPILAYRIATIATAAFSTRCRQIELQESRNIVNFVEDQKDIAKSKLEATERSLQEISNSSSFVINDDEGGLLKKLIEMEAQLAEVQSQRELAEANIADYDRRLRDLKAPEMTGMNENGDPTINRLHMEMDELIGARNKILNTGGSATAKVNALDQQIETKKREYLQILLADNRQKDSGSVVDQTILDQLRESRIKEELNLYLLKNRESLFRQWVERYRRENPKIVERAIEEARMKRGKTVYENLYNILLEKGEEARIKSATGSGGIRVIDEPVLPAMPVPSKLLQHMVLGFVLGLGLGLGLALMVEYLDNSIHSPQELSRKLGLAVIGNVPEITSVTRALKSNTVSFWNKFKNKQQVTKWASNNKNGYHDNLLFALRPRDPIIDAYRTLRTNLQFTSVDKPIRSLLITSSLPGEGKTLSSANLAISFAESGKKVVLVDADMRKPKQQDIFDIKKSPGLSDYLVRDLTLDQVCYPTKSENLKVVPCGTTPPNPAEMVGSQRMSDFINHAQEKFDLVIIDSPPVQIVSDPMPLAAMVSHVLLVVKFGKTQIRDLQETKNILHHVKASILGVIFNDIKVGRGYGNSHKYEYYYGYSSSNKK